MMSVESKIEFDEDIGEPAHKPAEKETEKPTKNKKSKITKIEPAQKSLDDLDIDLDSSHTLKLPADRNKKEESSVDEEIKDQPQYTDSELAAMRKGWTPKEQFKGDPSLWQNADYYLGKMEMADKISDRNKRIKRLEKTVEQAAEYFRKTFEMNQKNEQQKLQEELKQATYDQDVDKVNEITQKMFEMKNNNPIETEIVDKNSHEPTEEVLSFVEQNKDWFNNDTPRNKAMSLYAIEEDAKLAKDNPYLNPTERLKKVRELVVAEFPNYFKTENYSNLNENQYKGDSKMVDQPFETVSKSKNQPNKGQKKISWSSIPPHVKQVIHEMYRVTNNPGMTKEEYAQQYVNSLVKQGLLDI